MRKIEGLKGRKARTLVSKAIHRLVEDRGCTLSLLSEELGKQRSYISSSFNEYNTSKNNTISLGLLSCVLPGLFEGFKPAWVCASDDWEGAKWRPGMILPDGVGFLEEFISRPSLTGKEIVKIDTPPPSSRAVAVRRNPSMTTIAQMVKIAANPPLLKTLIKASEELEDCGYSFSQFLREISGEVPG